MARSAPASAAGPSSPGAASSIPKGLKQADELAYASRQLTAIEINGTYYQLAKPDSWAKWRDETPDGFMFAVKASRFCTNRKVLADALASPSSGSSTRASPNSATQAGPVLWQFAPTKKFDAADFEAFLELLPKA